MTNPFNELSDTDDTKIKTLKIFRLYLVLYYN